MILNWVLEWINEGIAIEAEHRHVGLILQEMGMQSCKESEVLGPPPNPTDEILLTGTDITQFRSLAARRNFLASDRVDIQFACKEIGRRMTWYLKAHPRMIVEFKYQLVPQHVTTRVDTEYAGCKRTRRSTNGGTVTLEDHLVKNWATTQTVVAISSGEAEHHAHDERCLRWPRSDLLDGGPLEGYECGRVGDRLFSCEGDRQPEGRREGQALGDADVVGTGPG